MTLIDKFEIELGVLVKIYSEPDPDWSWVEDDTDKRQVACGDLEQVFIEVSIYDKTGEVKGLDTLGGVVIGYDDHRQEIRDAIDDHDMIKETKEDLKMKLKKICSQN